MSPEIARSLLLLLGTLMAVGVERLRQRDRDRRKQALGPGAQPPLRYTRGAKILTGFALAAFMGHVALYFV